MADSEPAYYSFLPWVRQGIGAQIEKTDGPTATGPERPEVSVHLNLKGATPVTMSIGVYGPGDVIGIDPRAIARTDPLNWVTDFQPNYLPYVEFYDEDLPWRFSPAKATESHRLRPWITLIVLTEGEFDDDQPPPGPLPSITLRTDAPMPKPQQTWAWAHVHVNEDLAPSNSDYLTWLDKLHGKLAGNPGLAVSRLLCPRRLRPRTAYHAFVIPTFEVGRLAGLGRDTKGIDGLKSSWDNGQRQFPVYYRWYFRTGERGDFESQVKLLEPRQLDASVGIRPMDCQNPGLDVSGVSTGDPLYGALGLEGALKTKQTLSTQWPDSSDKFQSALSGLLNRQDGGEPKVTPPIYGGLHALIAAVQKDYRGWVDQLNLDPRFRVAAGLGALVVQQNQEKYMEAAWQQVGQVQQVNRRLRQAQLARSASKVYYQRHLVGLGKRQSGAVLELTAPVHRRIRYGDDATTVWHKVRNSTLRVGVFDGAFRRLVRPRGPLMRRLIGGQVAPHQVSEVFLNYINQGPAKPEVSVDGLITVERIKKTFLGGSMSAEELTRRQAALDCIAEGALTREQIDATPLRPDFRVTLPGQAVIPAGEGIKDSPEAAKFRTASHDVHTRLQAQMPEPPQVQAFDIAGAASEICAALDPENTIKSRVWSICPELKSFRDQSVEGAEDPLAPIMATPDFPESMYAALQDISTDLLIPNLSLVPQNTIAMLVTNQPFIEAYLVGLNHEMNRELLWREYPTDQRGTCFRQFWSVQDSVVSDPSSTAEEQAEELRDIRPIHLWERTSQLGEHNNRQAAAGQDMVVVVIRGDLLKKFPTAEIFAWKAEWKDNTRDKATVNEGEPDPRKWPIFGAEIGADLTFLGFDLTSEDAIGSRTPSDNKPGWFITFRERGGVLRFGLDESAGPATKDADTWADLTWGHLAESPSQFSQFQYIDLEQHPAYLSAEADKPIVVSPADSQGADGIQWDSHAADIAYIFYQPPYQVLVHAARLLKEVTDE
jgi:hypothetical protein